jgi:hypothetical protein
MVCFVKGRDTSVEAVDIVHPELFKSKMEKLRKYEKNATFAGARKVFLKALKNKTFSWHFRHT